MSEKAGKPYESLTKVIFKAIHGQKDFHNLVVKHDVTLQGKTRPHQIDVYWKFEFGGVPHEVIVQVKDWSKPVDQGQLIHFKGVLDELRGQPRGIFVTRTGYQRGAREFALAHGILLYELKEADDQPPLRIPADGWAHYRIMKMPVVRVVTDKIDANSTFALRFEWDVFTPTYSEIKLTVPPDWFQVEYPTEDPASSLRLTLPPVVPNETMLFDDKGQVVGNLGSVLRDIVMKTEGCEQKQVTHSFEPAVFIQTGSLLFPRIKVTAFSTTVEIKQTHEFRHGKMSNFTQLVLHQLNSNKKWWFAATREVISSLSKKAKP